ncbi:MULTISPECIES: AfsA-related hotdog domain-containing protein [unclassified Microbacterium]|uniref:AfsA-related hotdog domain-containing protein n=1 Tax=unclassified Microbacterium TaxID=2609290 RepID=UPI000EA94583|nr:MULTISPECIES: AfsA-related hotdog domain-containing protein [unclassified Microbacterium]MBT2486603.1 hypothetical protein [Microbacterium sp. ISL-108]RKN69288.1 hypothetical protein D7252_18050 [Microbacterium sp. CGR2]
MIASPVDPALTHKRAESNSWLTSYRVTDEDEMEASFSLPSSTAPPQLPALMEVWRQAGLVFAHRVLHVPMDHVFALASISLQMRDPGSWHRVSRQGVLHVSDCVFSVTRSVVRAAKASARMRLDSGEVLEGRLSARFLPVGTYARLRSASPALPREDAALPTSGYSGSTTGATAPGPMVQPFFDHEHDHVTAMTVVSAIERTVADTSKAALRGLKLDFETYIDAYPVPEIPLTTVTNGQFKGTVLQHGRLKASFSGSMVPALLPGVQAFVRCPL